MDDTQNNFINSLRTRNHNLISANAQLQELVVHMERRIFDINEQGRERESYIRFLESIIEDHNWNPDKEKRC